MLSATLAFARIALIFTAAGLAALPESARAAEPVPKAPPRIETRGPAPRCGALPRGDPAFKSCIGVQSRRDAPNPRQPGKPGFSSR